MSKNVIDSAIELATQKNIHLVLISSRRQIDSKIFGSGYVCNWDTKEFSKYVQKKDKKNKIILARDHGGTWQNELEVKKKLNQKQAIQSAIASLKEDIDSNFKILHLDTSIMPFQKFKIDKALEILYELYEFCIYYSNLNKKDIVIEVGTEEQNSSSNSLELFEYSLNKILQFCKKNNYKKPLFAVAQTGTKVLEFENIGSFDNPVRIKNEIPPEIQIPIISKICEKNNVFLKEHNTDYLSNEALSWHPILGIHAANVAPEFAIIETKTIYNLLYKNKLHSLLEEIVDLSLKSNKWMKWLKKDSFLDDKNKSILSCHYIYSSDEFKEIFKRANYYLKRKNIDINKIIKENIKQALMRYCHNFRMIN